MSETVIVLLMVYPVFKSLHVTAYVPLARLKLRDATPLEFVLTVDVLPLRVICISVFEHTVPSGFKRVAV